MKKNQQNLRLLAGVLPPAGLAGLDSLALIPAGLEPLVLSAGAAGFF